MKKLALAAVVLVVVVVGGAAGAYAYDSEQSDVIADGIFVAGVDVGGMTAADARATVARELADRLERPLAAAYRRGVFVLSEKRARTRVNVGGMVSAALAESRDGTFLARTLRDVLGRSEDATVRLRMTYSRRAVRRFVDEIAEAIYRAPREAKVIPSATSLATVPSEDGLGVRTGPLRGAIERELVDPASDRRVRVRTKVLEPKVSTEDLERQYPVFIAISRSERKLRLFKDLKLAKVYEVAIGAAGFDTPAGLHEIESKAANPAWYVPNRPWAGDLAGKVIPAGDPRNPIAARWMGFYDGAGIHGTYDPGSIGQAASHGCIRMRIRDVVDLYERVPLHTPVFIA